MKKDKCCIQIHTSLGRDVKSFQSTTAKRHRELVIMGVEDAHAEVEELELDSGTIIVTISDANQADAVVEALKKLKYDAKVIDRKTWLLDKVGVSQQGTDDANEKAK